MMRKPGADHPLITIGSHIVSHPLLTTLPDDGRAAFALDRKTLGVPRFEVPRVGIYGAEPAYLASKLSGLHRAALRLAPLGS